MEVKNINLFFPYGAAGNFIKNALTMDQNYILLDPNGEEVAQDKKLSFLIDYYNTEMNSITWIPVESTLRNSNEARLVEWRRGTNNNSAEFYPKCHESKGIISVLHEPSFDARLKWVDSDVLSDNMHHDQVNVFLYFENTYDLAEIYTSKNQGEAKLNISDIRQETLTWTISISSQSQRLYKFQKELENKGKIVYTLEASRMFTKHGYEYVYKLAKELGLDIPIRHIQEIHSLWFRSTCDTYEGFYRKKFPQFNTP